MRDQAQQALLLSGQFATVNSSAALCHRDAVEFLKQDFYYLTIERSMWSLRHSVGIFHGHYKKVATMHDKEKVKEDVRQWLSTGVF